MNIHEFFQATIDALIRWYMIHYDRNTWMDRWVGAIDITRYFETCEGTLSNGFFYFNWRKAALIRMTEGLGTDYTALPISIRIPEQYLWDSLYEEGFDNFCEGCHDHTDIHKDEVLDNLQQVSDAGNLEEQMAAVLWALHIQHTKGCIAIDYSQGKLNPHLVHIVQQNGLEAIFTPAEVNKFLRGGYPPLKVEGLRVSQSEVSVSPEGDRPT
jgi:hypothetical protein